MWLVNRDYRVLTEKEKIKYEEIREKEKFNQNGKMLLLGRRNLFREYPKAARYYQQLFPNNYLDIVELQDVDKLELLNIKFQELLNSKCNEQELLKYIKENKAYFIIGSILKNYNFWHHESYIFRNFN